MREKAIAWVNELIASGSWEDFQEARGAVDVLVHLGILPDAYEAALNARTDPNSELFLRPLD